MIYFLYGNDKFSSRKKMHSILDALCKKRPDAEIFKINTENFDYSKFEELIFSQGLFDSKYIVVTDNLFEDKNIKDFFIEKLPFIKDSANVFVSLESKVDVKSLKDIEKYSEKVQEFSTKEDGKKFFNVFGITDGILEKDKKRLWIDYLKTIQEGIPSEELHGIIFWQVKNMAIVSKVDSQKDCDLTPYQYKNALSGSRNYKDQDIERMMSDLVSMTHKVRSGEGDLDIMLEKWILGL